SRSRRGDHERMASEVSEGRALLPRQLVTTRHDQHSIRREQRLEPQTVRQRLPGPNREVQLAREQLIERLHVALVSPLESQGRVRLANPSPPPRPPPARAPGAPPALRPRLAEMSKY